MPEDNTPEIISEAVDQHIEDSKSIETLANDLSDAAIAFAAAFASDCSMRNMTDVDFRMVIEGRPDSDIKISFGTMTSHSGFSSLIEIRDFSSPMAVVNELFRQIDVKRAYAMPMITHKR